MPKKKTQAQRILEYLEKGKKISPIQALNMFGCLRLAARIKDLKYKGENIVSEMFKDKKTGKWYAKYYLA